MDYQSKNSTNEIRVLLAQYKILDKEIKAINKSGYNNPSQIEMLERVKLQLKTQIESIEKEKVKSSN